jgi:hypothetical protein
MGGRGSTRWRSHTKKETVEAWFDTLDIRALSTKMLRAGVHQWDILTSPQYRALCMTCEIDTTDMTAPWVGLFYKPTPTQAFLYVRVSLQTSTLYSGDSAGGGRPLVVNGIPCSACTSLYLPLGPVFWLSAVL